MKITEPQYQSILNQVVEKNGEPITKKSQLKHSTFEVFLNGLSSTTGIVLDKNVHVTKTSINFPSSNAGYKNNSKATDLWMVTVEDVYPIIIYNFAKKNTSPFMDLFCEYYDFYLGITDPEIKESTKVFLYHWYTYIRFNSPSKQYKTPEDININEFYENLPVGVVFWVIDRFFTTDKKSFYEYLESYKVTRDEFYKEIMVKNLWVNNPHSYLYITDKEIVDKLNYTDLSKVKNAKITNKKTYETN
jgi:hypothetical protein